ncbi:MAG: hypothetical protein ACLFV5_12180 [Anaerolineales bacterium]
MDTVFFGSRFPVSDDISQKMAYYFIMDAPIKESVELVAAALMLAAILAFAATYVWGGFAGGQTHTVHRDGQDAYHAGNRQRQRYTL